MGNKPFPYRSDFGRQKMLQKEICCFPSVLSKVKNALISLLLCSGEGYIKSWGWSPCHDKPYNKIKLSKPYWHALLASNIYSTDLGSPHLFISFFSFMLLGIKASPYSFEWRPTVVSEDHSCNSWKLNTHAIPEGWIWIKSSKYYLNQRKSIDVDKKKHTSQINMESKQYFF